MEINFQGQFSKQLFFSAVTALVSPSKTGQAVRIGAAVLVMAGYIALFILTGNKEEISNLDWMRLARSFITLPIILYFLLIPLLKPYSTARKLWKDTLLNGNISGRIDTRGIEVTYGEHGYSLTEWEKYQKKVISDDFIVLVTNSGILSLLQKNFFGTDQDWINARKVVDYKVMEAK